MHFNAITLQFLNTLHLIYSIYRYVSIFYNRSLKEATNKIRSSAVVLYSF